MIPMLGAGPNGPAECMAIISVDDEQNTEKQH